MGREVSAQAKSIAQRGPQPQWQENQQGQGITATESEERGQKHMQKASPTPRASQGQCHDAQASLLDARGKVTWETSAFGDILVTQ